MFSPGKIEPTVLPGMNFPSDEMRSRIFKLKEGETSVAANQPEDTYYVILVTKREPATYEGFARARFMIENQVQEMQRQAELGQWLSDLRKESSAGKIKAPAGS